MDQLYGLVFFTGFLGLLVGVFAAGFFIGPGRLWLQFLGRGVLGLYLTFVIALIVGAGAGAIPFIDLVIGIVQMLIGATLLWLAFTLGVQKRQRLLS